MTGFGGAGRIMDGDTAAVSQVFEYRFPSGMEWPIASMRVSVTDIAQRFQLEIERWEEDGLGPARGMLVRLRSGRVVLLRELEHAMKHLGAMGPDVFVDAGDLASVGVAPIFNDIVDSLRLPRDAVLWDPTTDAQRAAADGLARLKSFYEHRSEGRG